jgi:RNA polymerase sigma factor (sigma-70 family)
MATTVGALPADDPELVRRSLGGDREAFGLIVERYQSLVAAVAFSATGDLALSQDVAQETFLSAWKGLAGLREPGKLRSWLTGIARNLTRGALRARGRDALGPADSLEAFEEPPAAQPSPLDAVLSREEESLVRRALAALPDTYREPLVLFYREQRSIAAVAQALELSEDAVKQRLARGRELLKGHVATLVEGALARTRPGRAFTIAVLAALPALAPQAAAAAVAGAAAKGAAGKSALAATSVAGMLLGPLLGVLGAVVGIRASLENTLSPRERAYMVHVTRLGLLYVLAFGVVEALGLLLAPSVVGTLQAQLVLAGVYAAGLLAFILRTNRRQRQIRIEDGTWVEPKPVDWGSPAATKAAIYGSLGGGVFGSVCWIVPMAWIADDWPTAYAVLAAASVLFVALARVCVRRPQDYYRAAAALAAGAGGINLFVVVLRWEAYEAAYRASRFYTVGAGIPTWVMAPGIVVLSVWLVLRFLDQDRALRQGAPAGDAQRPGASGLGR